MFTGTDGFARCFFRFFLFSFFPNRRINRWRAINGTEKKSNDARSIFLAVSDAIVYGDRCFCRFGFIYFYFIYRNGNERERANSGRENCRQVERLNEDDHGNDDGKSFFEKY